MKVLIDGTERILAEGSRLIDAASLVQTEYEQPIAIAIQGGQLRELFQPIRRGESVTFLTIADDIGYEILTRSYCMLFLAAVKRVFGERPPHVRINFSVSKGLYCIVKGISIDDAFINEVTEAMRSMAADRLPIRKRTIPTATARKLFRALGMPDKEKLFRTRLSGTVNIYELDGYIDYFYGAMLYDTSILTAFRLIPYSEGVVLQIPAQGQSDVPAPFEPSEKVFAARVSGEEWCCAHKVGTVADLNEEIIKGDTYHTILVSEAYQEARIGKIAAEIVTRPGVKFVMIAGPSSSGKTTFSQRLCIQLSAHGMTPHCISVDNYFVNREDMVPGPDGKLDFEALEAVDTKQFNADMKALLAGRTVEMPSFDFVSGKRFMTGERMTLKADEILVIEGIHCLNDALTAELPAESRYKIYISDLTSLNVDEHNHIPSTDGRLIRRMVRDARTRGASAAKTLAMWPSVRAGEEKNIFPYQESADAVFNSALAYELAALKTFAEPLLFQVDEKDPSYFEAKHLLKFLDYFLAVPVSGVPDNSILREFIGGGCFRL